MRKQPKPKLYTEPEGVRRKLAAAYRKLATGKRFTPAERAEFARMADAWAATLPQKK
jgi:hypothetical protein